MQDSGKRSQPAQEASQVEQSKPAGFGFVRLVYSPADSMFDMYNCMSYLYIFIVLSSASLNIIKMKPGQGRNGAAID